MLQEFKKFAIKGNAIELAVGVVLGTAFGAIITSLVGDVIMPVIGVITGGVDFSGLAIHVGDAKISYGKFIQALFVFTVVSFALFVFIKVIAKVRNAEEQSVVPAEPSTQEKLLTEIRDLLKK